MKALLTAIATIALAGTPALAADLPVKAPPPPPAPLFSWTGFYAGIQGGGGWADEAVTNNLGNDPAALAIFSGDGRFPPLVSAPRVSQSGAAGGVEAGYNWQVGSNWLLGAEADFTASGMRGSNTATGPWFERTLGPIVEIFPQSLTAQVDTDWFGTFRGRAGWLATPNLLLFGTGGFAYGRVSDSATWGLSAPLGGSFGLAVKGAGGFEWSCAVASTSVTNCFAGNSGSIRTGWTAGGGAEWLFNQHWSAKIEYQYVDLGNDTVRVVNLPQFITDPRLSPLPSTLSFTTESTSCASV